MQIGLRTKIIFCRSIPISFAGDSKRIMAMSLLSLSKDISMEDNVMLTRAVMAEKVWQTVQQRHQIIC